MFFESGRRVAEALGDLAAVLGSRPAALARELTKRFETVRRGSLPALAAALAGEEPPKGEIVLLVAASDGGDAAPDAETLDARIRTALGHLSRKDAATVLAAETGLPRRQIYARAIALAAEEPPDP